MTIEISIVDIICRIVAAISVILCIVLYFYDRHKTAKWFKDNAKEKVTDNNEEPDNNYDEENIDDVMEQIKEIREETTKDGKVFTVLNKYR